MTTEASWFQALRATERHVMTGGHVTADDEAGQRVLARWSRQSPFAATPALFERKLAEQQLSQERLAQVLGWHLHAPPASPPWWAKLPVSPRAPTSFSVFGGDPLLALVEPLVERAACALLDHARQLSTSHAAAPFDPPTFVDAWSAALVDQLRNVIARTLVLELNVQRLQGRLQGANAAARFDSFVCWLQKPESQHAVFDEHPVLLRAVAERLRLWEQAGASFLSHLAADASSLAHRFNGGTALGTVTEVTMGGDRHDGGRAVALLRFSSGLRLVYKPRSLSTDVHLRQLVEWVEARSDVLPTRQLAVLDAKDHGWVELAEPTSVQSKLEVSRFYQRLGQQLALLHALMATDFHFENVIAWGEHPALIDLETLFQAPAFFLEPNVDDTGGHLALVDSVLRVSLLPQKAWVTEGYAGLDMGGLSPADERLSPEQVTMLDAQNTDEMRIVRRRVMLPPTNNAPRLRGHRVSAADYLKPFLRGFECMYRCLWEHRDALLAADGPIAAFADDEVRVILRDSRTYGELLHESSHPDVLRHPADQEMLLDRLWAEVVARPRLGRVIKAEQRDLFVGDIPRFTTRADSVDLYHHGQLLSSGYAEESGLAAARRRIAAMSEDDLAHQRWVIEASFATLAPSPQPAPATVSVRARPEAAPVPDVRSTELIELAGEVSDRLYRRALDHRGRLCWLGLQADSDETLSLYPTGLALYDGLPGVALFSAALAEIAGHRSARERAQRVTDSFIAQLQLDGPRLTSVGAFDGWGGIVFALSALASRVSQPDALWALHDDACAAIVRHAAHDTACDVVSGCAGAVLALEASLALRPTTIAREAMLACAERLAELHRPRAVGLGWSRSGGREATSGFAHGNSGIALSLVVAAQRLGRPGWLELSQQALAHEATYFDPLAGNWAAPWSAAATPGESLQRQLVVHWCYGAPGVGLARAALCNRGFTEPAQGELTIAAETTARHEHVVGHSLCHGTLGNVWLLELMAQQLKHPRLLHRRRELLCVEVAAIRAGGARCGNPLGVETPGLMNGLSGIGLALLAFADPHAVPDVLGLGAFARPTREKVTPASALAQTGSRGRGLP